MRASTPFKVRRSLNTTAASTPTTATCATTTSSSVEWRLAPTHETEYTLQSFAREVVAAGLKITHQEAWWGEAWMETVPDA